MEDAPKDQSSAPAKARGSSSKLLRYPLRSATKSKEEKPPVVESENSSAPRRGRPASSVSKSVGVLDLSCKEKTAKPPRRMSIPAKSTASPVQKPVGSITPISETRAKRSVNSQGKSDTPVSDVSKSANRRKFSALASASYWLYQIKLSESAAKHSISLGFFKLALEAGCEPLQRMRDELKAYAHRHDLVELGEFVKELFESYNILENFEQLQVSETCSLVPEEGTRSSDDDVHSSSVTGKLKPKSLNTDVGETSPVKGLAKGRSQKSNPVPRVRESLNKNVANSKSASDVGVRNKQKKSQKPSKRESNKAKDEIKMMGKECVPEEDAIKPSPAEDVHQEDKENMDSHTVEEVILTEV